MFLFAVLDRFGVVELLLTIGESGVSITPPPISKLVGVSPTSGLVGGVVVLIGTAVTVNAEALPVGDVLEDVPTLLTVATGVAGLYVWGTEVAALVPTSNPAVLLVIVVVLPFGAYLTLWSWRDRTRKTVERIVETITEAGTPATESAPEVAATAARLAQQVDIERPTVYVTDTDRPESFTLGSGGDAIVVVSTGLLERLDENEQAAVLAHEISHLANNDIRLSMAAFTPLYVLDREMTRLEERPVTRLPVLRQLSRLIRILLKHLFFRPLRLCARVGVRVLSVGREYAADRGSVALTGHPSALATALTKLDTDRSKPEMDRREWEETLAVLDILPPETVGESTGSLETHPPTSERVDRLKRLAARQERE
ncbi:M48 family metallopeptidase [Halobaculum sp. MBLA0147]|uniref:M48 family metallopeptidase n=1 Tax=Halobaculum sp. MBLA0147 TaxID=3079934 RepID=UPI0035255E3E